jgi:YgiT-type zinc finger domain-containing protein
MKWPFDRCPLCGGELSQRVVEKVLKGGSDTALMKVHADVCLRCGERLYPADTVRRFENVRKQLERRDTSGLQPLGKSFQVTPAKT